MPLPSLQQIKVEAEIHLPLYLMMFSNIVIFLLLLALISFCDLVSLPGNERKSMEQSLERGKKRHNMELSIVLPLAVILLDNRKTILCQTTTTPTIASLQHERVIQPWIYGAHGRARAFQISSQSNQLYVLMPVFLVCFFGTRAFASLSIRPPLLALHFKTSRVGWGEAFNFLLNYFKSFPTTTLEELQNLEMNFYPLLVNFIVVKNGSLELLFSRHTAICCSFCTNIKA